MNSPKEKAIELVNKFSTYAYYTDEDCCLSEQETMIKNSKSIALIAVDEILKVAFYSTDEIYNFYIEVKQEIEKL